MEHCIARDASEYFCAQPESVGSVNRQNLPRRIISLPVAYRGLQFVWKLWVTFLALISNYNIHIPILGRTMVVGAIGACTFTERTFIAGHLASSGYVVSEREGIY